MHYIIIIKYTSVGGGWVVVLVQCIMLLRYCVSMIGLCWTVCWTMGGVAQFFSK